MLLLQRIPASHRPNKVKSLKQFVQRGCLQRKMYVVEPVCLAAALSGDPLTGKAFDIVVAMLQDVSCRELGETPPVVPASALERIRCTFAQKLATGAFPSLSSKKGLIELCRWLTQVAYDRPSVDVDSIIHELIKDDAIIVDDAGTVCYNIPSDSAQKMQEFMSDPKIQRLLSPMPLPRFRSVSEFRPSNKTAVVIVPPLSMWAPYMEFVMATHPGKLMRRPPYPHITLLNAFVPKESMQSVLWELRHTMSQISPFHLRFRDLKVFPQSRVAHLNPVSQPSGSLSKLQKRIQDLMPASKYQFDKHIGMGTLDTIEQDAYFEHFSRNWKDNGWNETSFTVSHVLVMELPNVTDEEERMYDLDWQLLVQGPDGRYGRQVKDARPWVVSAVVPLKGVTNDTLPILHAGQKTLMSDLCPKQWRELQSWPMKARRLRAPAPLAANAPILERSFSSQHEERKIDRDHALQRKSKDRGSGRRPKNRRAWANFRRRELARNERVHHLSGGRFKPGEKIWED